jgi:predicted Zn-dependent protease
MSAEEGLRETRKAIEYDPYNSWALSVHSFFEGYVGRPADALEASRRAVEADPASFFAQWSFMRSHAFAGDLDGALALAPSLLVTSGRNAWALGTFGWILAKANDPSRARAVYDEMEARSRLEHMSPFWLAVAAAAADLPQEALGILRRAVAMRDPLVLMVRVFPHTDQLRAIDGFEDVVKGAWD